jgi:plastocyanin
MKFKFIFLIFVLLTFSAAQATVWQVYIGANFFAPESLVVALGDTVVWTDLDGVHSVVENSDPPVFSSGAPAPPPWSYQFVFFNLSLGIYHYYCAVHGPAMSGSITVIPYGTPPNIEFDNFHTPPNPPSNGNVGLGFPMTVVATDENQDLTGYVVSINDTLHWSGWSPFPEFLFCDLSLGLFPDNTTLISNNVLTTGNNVLYFRAIDSRQFLSPIISRTLNVQSGHSPTLDTTITGIYAGADLYPDRSAYYQPGNDAEITFQATAPYYGVINAYRLQTDDGAWSEWFAENTATFPALPAGDLPVLLLTRDVAGELSDTVSFVLHMVPFALTDLITIVDETRNGTGVPGSPNDVQVDAFYDTLFIGQNVTHVDYTVQGFVSPLLLQNAGLVMWHADDKAEFKLADNTRVLSDYLNRGGHLIVSGWDVMTPFTNGLDSLQFSGNSFAYSHLWTVSAARNTPRTSTGFTGDSGFPTCRIDSTKLPVSWAGTMDKLWTFTPREQSVIIGRLSVSNSGSNPFEGRPAAYYYDGSFRVAIFGVPLYFCHTDQVQALFDMLVPLMMAPVSAPPPAAAPVASFALEQNYPNPFNASTEISFSLPHSSPISLQMFDVLGRQVATVLDKSLPAGAHHVHFDGSALPSGIYFLQLRAGEFSQSRKMVLLK